MIRPYRDTDREAVLRINADNVPEVGPMDDAKLDLLLDAAGMFRVVEVDGEVVGLFIGLPEGTAYRSPNYALFGERHTRFAYVDRIALSAGARGGGWGPALYHQFEHWARGTERPVMCAEVNVEPPNPRSTRFHERFGFVAVAETSPYGPDDVVAMFEKDLSAG